MIDTMLQTGSRQEALELIIDSVQRGRCCRALGPRRSGKSGLMQQVKQQLQARGYAVSLCSLLDIPDSEHALFSTLYVVLCESLDCPPLAAVDSWTPAHFQNETLRLLHASGRRVAMLIDDIEMAMPNLVASLLQTVRAIYTTTVNEEGFMVVVCGSFVSRKMLRDARYSSFEIISDRVLIGDYDDDERREYAMRLCEKEDLIPTEDGLAALFAQTGGDGFLIKRVIIKFKEIAAALHTAELNADMVNHTIETLLMQPTRPMLDALALLEESPEWLEAALDIMKRGTVARSELEVMSRESPNQLDLSGAFIQTDDYRYRIKCPLWERLLRRHFTDARIGSLYVAIGDWERGLEHLGEAIKLGDEQAKAQLFGAVINAIYTSGGMTAAFEYLALGLHHLYPDYELTLYRSEQDGSLEVLYPPYSSQTRTQRRISAHTAPEIKALDGTDYTFDDQTNRLLIPLRFDPDARRHIGLVCLQIGEGSKLKYAERSEMQGVIAFLNQASVALKQVEVSSAYLEATEQRARQFSTLNQLLSEILKRSGLSQDDIYRLMLAGVTSHLGLEFNRAILFLVDQRSRQLVVKLGVGDLDKKKAQKVWKSVMKKMRTVDDLIDAAVNSLYVNTPLHQAAAAVALSLLDDTDLIVHVTKTKTPLLVQKTKPHLPLSQKLCQQIAPHDRYALVPLVGSGERALGVLYVDDKFLEREIKPERFELLRAFVTQIALIVEIQAETERQKQRRKTLTDFTPLIGGTLERDPLYKILLEQLTAVVKQANHACVVELRAHELFIPAVCKPFYEVDESDSTEMDDGYHFSTDKYLGIAGRAIREGKSFNVINVDEDRDYRRAIHSTRSQLCVPLPRSSTALVLESDSENAFSDDDQALLEALADTLAVALRNAHQYTELEAIKQEENNRRMMEHMAEMATGLIHDMTHVSGGVSDKLSEIEAILRKSAAVDGDVYALLHTIKGQMDEVDRISASLRDYVVLKKLNPVVIALREVVERAVKEETQRKPDHVEIELMSASSPLVYVDKNWVQLVFKNLISNACNAIPKNRHGKIEIRWRKAGDRIEVRVSDNGKGIKKEDRPHVFDPGFSTRKDERKMHGIGLYHCKLVIEEHKGKIDFRTKPGKGTIMRFTLPTRSWEEEKS